MIALLRTDDLFKAWEEFMADIESGLKDKYGLKSSPNLTQINEWVRRTEEFIKRGYSSDKAGEEAAKVTFPDFRAGITKSDADTIASLLDAAKRKTRG